MLPVDAAERLDVYGRYSFDMFRSGIRAEQAAAAIEPIEALAQSDDRDADATFVGLATALATDIAPNGGWPAYGAYTLVVYRRDWFTGELSDAENEVVAAGYRFMRELGVHWSWLAFAEKRLWASHRHPTWELGSKAPPARFEVELTEPGPGELLHVSTGRRNDGVGNRIYVRITADRDFEAVVIDDVTTLDGPFPWKVEPTLYDLYQWLGNAFQGRNPPQEWIHEELVAFVC